MILWFLIGVVALVLLLILARWLANLPTSPLKRVLKLFLSVIIGVGALLLLLRIGLSPIITGLLALAPALMGLWSRFRRFNSAKKRTSGQSSHVSSEWLDMALDHDSGGITGIIRKGPHKGTSLDALNKRQINDFAAECASDPDSVRLLAAYIKKRFGNVFSEEQSQDDSGKTSRSSVITRDEALSILGLHDPVSNDEVNAAYKRLISKVHPDAGGNAFLAARVNEARDILLKGR